MATEVNPVARVALVFLALCWIVAGLITVVMVLLLTSAFSLPECASFDPDGQTAARIGSALVAVLLVAIWIVAVLVARSKPGSSAVGRVVLGIALPIMLIQAFIAGASLSDWAVERVAGDADHAMCW